MMKKGMYSGLLMAGCLGLLALISACGGGAPKKGSLSGTISMDGSSTVYPISEAVAEEFAAVHPQVKITIGVSGTGGGFKKFGRNEVDITNASRPIKSGEDSVCRAAGVDYIGLEVAYDGMAVVVNPENDWARTITMAELKMIWEPAAQGKIKYWNQIRKEWPRQEIHLFGPGIASGTYDYFTETVVGKSGSSRGDYTASEDDNVLVQGIAGDKYALGFFGHAYYEENANKLGLVGVDAGMGPVLPTFENISNGTYAPLSRPIFIYVTKQAAARPEVQEFVSFYMENAGSLAKEVGYVALPAEKYTRGAQAFREFAGMDITQ